MSLLLPLLESAHERRLPLAARLSTEGTDCWRLFHGGAEGRPGLTLDRYGPLVLAQTFREPLEEADLSAVRAFAGARHPDATAFAWNHRGPAQHAGIADETEHVAKERGVEFLVCARHRGQDPWLFLDLREARARFAAICEGKSVLNLFAYTSGAGLAAAAAGASEVWNVDFAGSALDVGRRSAERNRIDPERMRFLREDCLPLLRQLAGFPVKGRASAREFTRFEPRRFDRVFLDPPAWAKSPFGAVDVVRDYASLFKPALLLLEPGGVLCATNHAPEVALADWTAALTRAAEKAGRPLVSLDTHGPGEDFPAFDGAPPLKVAWCRVA